MTERTTRKKGHLFGVPSLTNTAKQLVPPIALTAVKRLLAKDVYSEWGFRNWEEAERASEGYDSDNYVAKVARSAKLVLEGKATYERDTVIFDEIQYSWPLLAALLFVAANRKVLRVLDFGGALGTTFQQNRKFLTRLEVKCDWRIVEQPKLVKIGKKSFTNDYLTFYDNIPEATKEGVDVVLFAGSVFYVADAYRVLDQAVASKAPFIVLDRTPITAEEDDTFAVLHVPRSIYRTSYPVRNFNFSNLMKPFQEQYELLERWSCDLQTDPRTTSMGFIFKIK